MSQARTNRDNNKSNKIYNHYNKQQRPRKGMEFDNYHYNRPYNKFQYYSAKYNFHPRWSYRRRKPPHHAPERQYSRSPSPFSGTEEYTMKKIQETSDMIKKRLMMPESEETANAPKTPLVNNEEPVQSDMKMNKNESERSSGKINKKAMHYNVEEIHHKIITHITNLSHGKKMNLICANSSGYDVAIQQIHKQKRLELSKVLRDMCSNQSVENSEVINAIIPDIGIKIEDLPLEVIQELSSTLHLNFDDASCSQSCEETASVKTEICENEVTGQDSKDVTISPVQEENNLIGINSIKQEIGVDTDFRNEAVVDEVDIPMETSFAFTNSSPLDDPNKIQENNCGNIEIRLENSSDVHCEKTGSVKTEICENEVTDQEHSKDVTTSPVQEENNLIGINNIKQEVDVDTDFRNEAVVDEVDFPMETSFSFTNSCPDDPNKIQENNFGNIEIKLENSSGVHCEKTVTVSLQTDSNELKTIGTQTDCNLTNCNFNINKDNINSLDDAITAMLKIDKEIARLTTMRQSIFSKIQKKEHKNKEPVKNKGKNQGKSPTKRVEQVTKNAKSPPKKHRMDTRTTTHANNKSRSTNSETKTTFNEVNTNFDVQIREEETYYKKPLNFDFVSEKILVMKLIENILLAASEQGNIFYINTLDGTILTNICVSEAPIISLCYWITGKGKLFLLVGCANSKIHEFNYETRELVRSTNTKDCVQCMDVAWFYIFIGTTTGNLLRYSLKQSKIEFKEKISDDNVMVLKATQEGARRVLLVGMRNAPVYIRDAMSGLRLRTMNELVTPTVYNLILENSMVYCGTTAHDILVYTFHDGNLVHKYQATNSKGISCMRVSGDLLFASCYNGNIYAYDIKSHNYIGSIEGPGGVILSMEIVKNIVIVGTMSLNFKSFLIPEYILEHNKI